MKKILSLLMSIILVFNFFAFTAYAKSDDESIEWSEQDVLWYIDEPEREIAEESDVNLFSEADTSWYDESQTEFVISTTDEFMGFITLANGGNDFTGKKITLQSDIVFTEALNPIASFNGELDGAGHILSVHIASSTDDNTALFKILGENANVHDFSVDGVIVGNYVAAVVGTNNGIINGVHSLASVQGNKMCGSICVENNGTIRNSSANNSVAISSTGISMGGICAKNTGTIENCENKAKLNTDSATPTSNIGGIVGENNGTITNSFNYSDISGKDYIGGIVGKNTKDITNCINTAEISSLSSYVGGIAGSNATNANITGSRNSGDITCGIDVSDTSSGYYVGGITGTSVGNVANSENAGDITSAGTGAGGIVAVGNGNITDCTNYGTITANGSMAGGIIGTSTAGKISLTRNYGTVSAWKYMGGIVGQTKKGSTIDKSSNFGAISALENDFDNTNFAGGIVGVNEDIVEDCLNVSKTILSKWNFGSIAGFSSADDLIENSYSIGELKLTGNNKSNVSAYVKAENDVSLTDGTLLASLNNDRNVWYAGEEYPLPYEPDTAKHISTLEELNTLLANESVSEIVLDNDIEGDITISHAVKIDGQYHSVGSITQNAAATFKNLCVNGEITSTADLTLDGVVSISDVEKQGILTSANLTINGAIDFDNPTIPMITKTNGTVTGADNLYYDNGSYYFNYPITEVDKTTIVVKAENNGLSYDIYPYISGVNCYFFMPYSADLSNIKYTKIHSDGTTEDIIIDLSDGKTDTINIMGINFTASAMTSELPVLYLNVDEQYGSIYAMNNSPKHEAKCYGDMRLEIPDEMAKVKGWNSVYTSVGNDKDTEKPGTMELRGRGNSSWSQAIRTNGPRPYQLKLEKKLNLMGMGSAKTYTLLKSDQIQSTNKTFLDMSIDMGMKYTPQSEFVDVYLNGDYIGMYTLAEKVQIDKERVNISDLESEIEDGASIDDIDTTGGYLLEIDNTNEDLQFMTQGNRVTIKSPENLDTTVAKGSKYDYIVNLMTDLFDAVYGDGYLKKGDYAGKHFTEVLDMDSVTRYFLEQELTSNLDNGLGSTFFYKDKDSIDSKIYMGIVWDNDRCGGTNTISGWQLPEINEYGASGTQVDGADSFFKAMCKHKEFISYILAYYKNNVNNNNIKTIFKEYAEKANQNGEYINTAAVMSRLRWNHTWPFTPTKLGTFISQRAAWVDENIDTISEYGVKGKEIEVVTQTPNPNPAVQPTENPHMIVGYRYANGTAGGDLDASLGDKTNGYKATVGVQKDSAILFVSVNGENTKTLEWADTAYVDGENSYLPAVVSASKKNMWSNPYVDITLSAADCEKLYFSAKLGATKKGPSSYKLQYSLDGEKYIDVENANCALTDNRNMQQAFEYIELPQAVCGHENVHIRITTVNDLAVSGLPLSANPDSGEFALNDIFIYDEKPPHIEKSYNTDGGKINISVTNNMTDTVSADIYTAVYGIDGMLVKVFKDTQDITDTYSTSYDYTPNDSETVRIFCWEKGTMQSVE